MHRIAIPQAAIDRVLKRRDLLHVFGDIAPSRTAHIVVDLQNGFMAPGQPIEIPAAREIVPNVNRVSAALRGAGGIVIYIQHTIDATAKETWSTWFNYISDEKRRVSEEAAFVDGSYGHSLWPDLEILPGDLKVKKTRFGAFVPGSSELHTILQARNIDTLIITGTATVSPSRVGIGQLRFLTCRLSPKAASLNTIPALSPACSRRTGHRNR